MRDRTTSIVLCIIGLLLILFAISSRKPIPLDSLKKVEKQTATNTNQNTGLRLFVDGKIAALTKENLRLNNEVVKLITKLESYEEDIYLLQEQMGNIQQQDYMLQIKELQDQYSTAKTYALEEYNNATNRLYKLEQSVEEFYKDKKYFFSERDRINRSIQDLYKRIDELKNAQPKIEEKKIYVPCVPRCR